MTETSFNAPDFARAVGCSPRFARYWLRKRTSGYRESHVRLDAGQFREAVAQFNEERLKRAIARRQTRPLLASCRRTDPGKRDRLKARVIASYRECGNASEAARRVRVNPRTARRWLREQQLKAEVNLCQSQNQNQP